jgi:hypothetical protein
MFWVCFQNDKYKDWDKGIGALFFMQVSDQTYIADECQQRQGDNTRNSRPKMTLQQFSIQINLSRGAL